MKLQDIMVRDVVQIGPAETIAEAAKAMLIFAVGCLVVTVAGAVKGLITDRDLLGCLHQDHDPYACPVSTHMRHPVTVLGPDEEALTAAQVMSARRIKRLPVASNGRLLGIVSLSDLATLGVAEAIKLGASLEFSTSVARAQSAQHKAPAHEQPARPQTVIGADVGDVNEQSPAFDARGPG